MTISLRALMFVCRVDKATYIGFGTNDADIRQSCLTSQPEEVLQAFVGCGASDGTHHEDLMTLTDIALRDVLPCRIEVTEACAQKILMRK
jgi:hypothetical protein